MELTESQYERIADCLPRQRGNVSMTNLQLLNALLYVAEQGCKTGETVSSVWVPCAETIFTNRQRAPHPRFSFFKSAGLPKQIRQIMNNGCYLC